MLWGQGITHEIVVNGLQEFVSTPFPIMAGPEEVLGKLFFRSEVDRLYSKQGVQNHEFEMGVGERRTRCPGRRGIKW